MIFDLRRYQVVIIDYPIFCMDDPFCVEMLTKAFKMKIEGYNSTYTERVLPFDKADFFGTHIVFCEEIKNELVPIFAYKSSILARCLKHNFEFPAITSVKTDGHPSLVSDINRIIEKVNNPELIAFDSSWAQNIDYRFNNDQDQKERIREIVMAMGVHHHREWNLPHFFCTGVVKVKTDKIFLRMGLKKLNEHAHHNEHFMDHTEMVIFYNDSFSEEALAAADKYEYLWKKKLVVNGLELKNVGRKRAA